MKEFKCVLRKQRLMEEEAKGDFILEPDVIIYDSEKHDVYWRKYRHKPPIKINYFRIYVMNENKERILHSHKVSIPCPKCGKSIRKYGVNIHLRSKKCQKERQLPLIYKLKQPMMNETTLPDNVIYDIEQGQGILKCSDNSTDKFTYHGFQEYCSLLELRSRI